MEPQFLEKQIVRYAGKMLTPAESTRLYPVEIFKYFFLCFFLLNLLLEYMGSCFFRQPALSNDCTCRSLPGLLYNNGTRTMHWTSVVSWFRFFVEDLDSFWRKICVSLGWKSTDHDSLRRTTRRFTLIRILDRLYFPIFFR